MIHNIKAMVHRGGSGFSPVVFRVEHEGDDQEARKSAREIGRKMILEAGYRRLFWMDHWVDGEKSLLDMGMFEPDGNQIGQYGIVLPRHTGLGYKDGQEEKIAVLEENIRELQRRIGADY